MRVTDTVLKSQQLSLHTEKEDGNHAETYHFALYSPSSSDQDSNFRQTCMQTQTHTAFFADKLKNVSVISSVKLSTHCSA